MQSGLYGFTGNKKFNERIKEETLLFFRAGYNGFDEKGR